MPIFRDETKDTTTGIMQLELLLHECLVLCVRSNFLKHKTPSFTEDRAVREPFTGDYWVVSEKSSVFLVIFDKIFRW